MRQTTIVCFYSFFVFCRLSPILQFRFRSFLAIFRPFRYIFLLFSIFSQHSLFYYRRFGVCCGWSVGGVVLGGSGHGMALASDGAAGSEGKPTKVAQRPVDDGPALTLPEIQLAPVIWAKLSGYSWWPARVRAVPQTSAFNISS